MFKQKPSQDKKESKPNAKLLKSLEKYHSKIKEKHFEIYLNSGVNQFENISAFRFQSSLSMSNFEELSQNAIKGFSSFYKMDHKTFQWIDKMQGLINSGKQIIKIIDKLKHQMSKIDSISNKNQILETQNEKLTRENNQLNQQCQNLKRLFQSTIKVQQSEPLLIVEKKIKDDSSCINQTSQELQLIKQKNMILQQQNSHLKQLLKNVQIQNVDLKNHLKKIYNASFGQKTISQALHKPFNLSMENLTNFQQNVFSPNKKVSFQKDILQNQQLSPILVQFLSPIEINKTCSLSRSSRFFLLHNPKVVHSIFRSINGFKNFEISYFHRHIEHFQKLMKKIPEEIIQSTFYQFNILKQNIGGDFLSVINLCSSIFQGKMNANNSHSGKVVKEYLDSKEIIHHVIVPKQQEIYLQVQKQVVNQFLEQRKGKKLQIMKEIESMSSKISLTESLYSVDEASSKQFYQNIMKYFTVLFVLSKYLFSQARNLQYLNNFLLSQLSEITKFRIQKQYDLQDIQTQLQSAIKMNEFLSDKCNKSQQRILRQSKQLLELQKDISEIKISLKQQIKTKNQLLKEIQLKSQEQQKAVTKNNELKTLYNATKDKYNRLLNQLNIVKDSILKIK